MLRRSCASLIRSNLIRSGAARKTVTPLAFRGISSSNLFRNVNDDFKNKNINSQVLKENEDKEVIREDDPSSSSQFGLANESEQETIKQEEEQIGEDVILENTEEPREAEQYKEFEEESHKEVTSETPDAKEVELENQKVEVEEEEVEEGDIPWYMREEESSKLDTPIFKAEIPELPEGSPASLQPILEHAAKVLGFDNIKIFDIRDRNDLYASAHLDFMVIVSGKSEKHIQNAVDEFNTYLKHEFDTVPHIEGLLKANSIKRQRSRMKKKAKRGSIVDTEYGVGPNSWVMIDTGVDSIALHVMTKERREFVNLEYLWCKPEEKELYKKKISHVESADVDSIFHGLQRRFYSTEVEIDLFSKATQQLQLGDFEGLRKISEEIQHDNEMSAKISQYIINEVSSMEIGEAREVLGSSDNKYVEFFNELFPVAPSLQHWDLKVQFYSILNGVDSETYPLEKVANILVHQAAAGEPISRKQLDDFIWLSISITKVTSDDSIRSLKEVNKTFKYVLDNLSKLLRIWDIQTQGEIDEQLMIQLLLLSSQEPLNTSTTEPIIISSAFKKIHELFHQNTTPSNNVIHIVLKTLANAHDYQYFWKCWEDLKSYEATSNEVIYDIRPWAILIDVVEKANLGKLNEAFINEQIPTMIENEVEITDEMKVKIYQIMDNYGAPTQVREQIQ